jgi:hypothetical protein
MAAIPDDRGAFVATAVGTAAAIREASRIWTHEGLHHLESSTKSK